MKTLICLSPRGDNYSTTELIDFKYGIYLMDPMSMKSLAKQWISSPPPNQAWCTLVEDASRCLMGDSSPEEKLRAWAKIATFFGDSGAPEFCVLVSVYALVYEAGEYDNLEVNKVRIQLRSHRHLACLELGLLGGAPESITSEKEKVSPIDLIYRWLRDFLSPVEGDLSRGASLCLKLANMRVKATLRPEVFVFEEVLGRIDFFENNP